MNKADSGDMKRVSTYVPPEQKDEWKEHADEMDMTQSEFVRAMVQAGRRNFTVDLASQSDSEGGEVSLEDTVLSVLEGGETLDWGELVAELTGSVEEDLEDALDALQEQNRVRYSGREGGYSLKETNE